MELKGNPAGIPELGFTHAGRFHADDVFSAALLQLLRPDIRILRGYRVPLGFSGIVFDIGDGKFDHHQKGSPRRANGAAYAAFGLLWREYGTYLLSEKEAQRFDEKFIQPIDIDDNTGSGHLLAVLLGAFNPSWDEDVDEDAAFFEAVAVAKKLLYHRLKSIAATERGRDVVEKALAEAKDGVVVLPLYAPWKPVLVPSDAEFVVVPSPRGGYSLQCVPKDYNGKTGNKVPLPTAWHAAPAAELQKLTGVEDVSFCHASGFMCSVQKVDSAVELARQAKEQYLQRKAEKELEKAQKTPEQKIPKSEENAPKMEEKGVAGTPCGNEAAQDGGLPAGGQRRDA